MNSQLLGIEIVQSVALALSAVVSLLCRIRDEAYRNKSCKVSGAFFNNAISTEEKPLCHFTTNAPTLGPRHGRSGSPIDAPKSLTKAG
ncbi:unnamed protein product [Arctogadus glacialis]